MKWPNFNRKENSEFEIQAVAYCALTEWVEKNNLPFVVRGEFCIGRMRADICVFNDHGEMLVLIEVKNKKTTRDQIKSQMNRYSRSTEASLIWIDSIERAKDIVETVSMLCGVTNG